MIDSFDPYDDVDQFGIVMMDVLDQLGLGISRPCNEHCSRIRDGSGNRVQIIVVLCGVPAPDRIGLVMDVAGWIVRMQDKTIGGLRVEVEHARFMVIDPDDGVMVVTGQWLAPSDVVALA